MAETAAIQALSTIASTIAAPAARCGRPETPPGRAPLWEWFLPGQVVELSAPAEARAAGAPQAWARSSVVASLIVQAQAQAEPVVWIEGSMALYPPDLAAVGVDLSALVVVQPQAKAKSERSLSVEQQAVRAAEVLLRSGAFGLVVLDLSQAVPARALSWLSKLHGLLRLHACRLLVLTHSDTEAASVGPLVSLRVEPRCRRVSAERWVIEHAVLKNKLGADVRISPEVRVAPEGATPVRVGPSLASAAPGAWRHAETTPHSPSDEPLFAVV